MNRAGWPVARPGQVIGLLGGSFDPAHGGHLHITREALKRFGLDRAWWLVSPGNPLKERGPAPMERRLAQAREVVAGDPRIIVTDLEARLGTRFTAETLERLGVAYPGVRFVWLMGADNLAGFHHWDNWRRIISTVPIGVLARPSARIAAQLSPAARIFAPWRLHPSRAQALGHHPAPAWCFVNIPLRRDSSTALRAGGDWPAQG